MVAVAAATEDSARKRTKYNAQITCEALPRARLSGIATGMECVSLDGRAGATDQAPC